MSDSSIFQQRIYAFYHEHGRHDLPWRKTNDPYKIFISEIMLQQTQVPRVIEKYNEFVTTLPSFASVVSAPQSEVIRLWQGLGYNRRALFLKRSADMIETQFQGKIPNTTDKLLTLPGVGPNTAGSLLAFVYNQPAVFIETNIRRVFINEFFKDRKKITDKNILPLIEKLLDKKNPREWYYALMDYGTLLAKRENVNQKSAHYTKQSTFKGSKREVRGMILKLLSEKGTVTTKEIQQNTKTGYNLDCIVTELEHEGFLTRVGSKLTLK